MRCLRPALRFELRCTFFPLFFFFYLLFLWWRVFTPSAQHGSLPTLRRFLQMNAAPRAGFEVHLIRLLSPLTRPIHFNF